MTSFIRVSHQLSNSTLLPKEITSHQHKFSWALNRINARTSFLLCRTIIHFPPRNGCHPMQGMADISGTIAFKWTAGIYCFYVGAPASFFLHLLAANTKPKPGLFHQRIRYLFDCTSAATPSLPPPQKQWIQRLDFLVHHNGGSNFWFIGFDFIVINTCCRAPTFLHK